MLCPPLDQYILMGTGYPPQQHYMEKSGRIASKERWALRPVNIDLPALPLSHPSLWFSLSFRGCMDFELNGIELSHWKRKVPHWKRNLLLKTFPKSSHGSVDFKIIGLLHVGLLGYTLVENWLVSHFKIICLDTGFLQFGLVIHFVGVL